MDTRPRLSTAVRRSPGPSPTKATTPRRSSKPGTAGKLFVTNLREILGDLPETSGRLRVGGGAANSPIVLSAAAVEFEGEQEVRQFRLAVGGNGAVAAFALQVVEIDSADAGGAAGEGDHPGRVCLAEQR